MPAGRARRSSPCADASRAAYWVCQSSATSLAKVTSAKGAQDDGSRDVGDLTRNMHATSGLSRRALLAAAIAAYDYEFTGISEFTVPAVPWERVPLASVVRELGKGADGHVWLLRGQSPTPLGGTAGEPGGGSNA